MNLDIEQASADLGRLASQMRVYLNTHPEEVLENREMWAIDVALLILQFDKIEGELND